MKTIVTTLNAKYIHGSLALRLLYVANKDRFDISFREYTIKENIEAIASDLLSSGCDCIGFGVYIWNVEKIKKLIVILKEKKPDIILILGGPEVSYEPAFFLENFNIDYVISGEGEFVLGELLQAVKNGGSIKLEGVSSLNNVTSTIARADIDRLINLPSPYQLEEDKDDLQHKLIYFETSRGCPYQCAYCLSSLEHGVRYFPQEYIRENLDYLINNGARQIKFLDRTFNLNKKHTRQIFEYLVLAYKPGLSCQFEIYADLLDDEMLQWLNNSLPENYFRFEVGIQSTFEPSNLAVNRKQDFQLLSRNINRLSEGGKIDLHLDLIAGLPYETLDRFIQSFNDVFGLKAKEVQLGFLKMLRGTALRNNASRYGYIYETEAPYEIKSNDSISPEELKRIHDAEHALEKFWNSGRFSLTMNALFDSYYQGKYFEFFDEMGQYYEKKGYRHHGYQLEDLFRCMNLFLLSKNIDLFSTLREDYYNNFRLRPTKGFWENTTDKKEWKRILNLISQDNEFLQLNGLSEYAIKKQTAIDEESGYSYLLTVFLPEGKRKLTYTLVES